MVCTQIQLTEEQAAALKKLAAKRRTSVAKLLQCGVEIVLRSSGTVISKEQRVRAIAAAGRFHSGRSDLAEKHDEHLAEVYDK
jgi:CRISPR/Cas system-associated protein Csm6